MLEQRFNQNAWLTCGPLSGAERLCNPRRWVARPSSGCRQMCLEAESRGLPKSYCTVGCGTVPRCVAHCWVMKCTPGGFCRVSVLIWGRPEINGQLSMQKRERDYLCFRVKWKRHRTARVKRMALILTVKRNSGVNGYEEQCKKICKEQWCKQIDSGEEQREKQ